METQLKLRVAPKNKEQFLKKLQEWHLLAGAIGWDTLAEMWHKRVDPFRTVAPTKNVKEAKNKLMAMMAGELREASLEVIK